MSIIYDDYAPHQRFFLPKRNLPEKAAAGDDLRRSVLPNYYIFPNTVLTLPHDHMTLTQVFPRGVEACTFYTSLLTLEPPASADAMTYWEKAWQLTTSVNAEDFMVIESIQRAYQQGASDDMIHGRNEYGITLFHDACEQRLRAGA
jgi:hypothetical protein